MPTPDLTTFALVHDLSRGAELGTCDAISGYLTRLPNTMYAGDSMNITLTVYEKYSTSSPDYCNWPATSVAKMYVKHADTVEDPVLVSTGSLTQVGAEYCVMNFTVYADDISESLAGAAPVVFIFQVTEATVGQEVQCTIFQRLYLTTHDGTSAASLETKDLDVSVSELVADTTLTAYPGRAIYLLDGSAATVAVTLPTLTAGEPQEIILQCVNADHAVSTVAATINGAAATALSFTPGDTAHLITDGTSWYCLNYAIFVRP